MCSFKSLISIEWCEVLFTANLTELGMEWLWHVIRALLILYYKNLEEIMLSTSRSRKFLFFWFLVNDQRDAQIPFYVFIFVYNSLHVSSTSCSSSGETNCINTTSGNCLLPTCTQLGYQRSMTVTRGCIDTICLSWWWARYARNM